MLSDILLLQSNSLGLADTLLLGIHRANDGELMFSAVVLIALNGDLNGFGSNEGVGFAHQLQYALHPIRTQHWMPSDSS